MVLDAVLELTVSLVVTSVVLVLLGEIQHLAMEFLVFVFFVLLIQHAALGWITLAWVLLSSHNVSLWQKLLESSIVLAIGDLGLLLFYGLAAMEALKSMKRLFLLGAVLLLYVVTTATGSFKNVERLIAGHEVVSGELVLVLD